MDDAKAPKTKNVALLHLPGYRLYIYMMSLPVLALFACVILSLVYDFKRAVWTSCEVANYLPSISSTIGKCCTRLFLSF